MIRERLAKKHHWLRQTMIDPSIFENLAQKISSKLPASLGNAREEVEKNLKAGLQATFTKLDLVTREEFDVQSKMLAKCRERIEALEAKVTALEAEKLKKG